MITQGTTRPGERDWPGLSSGVRAGGGRELRDRAAAVPATPARQDGRPDPLRRARRRGRSRPVRPEGPDFRETFCADVPVDMADVMFATQRPLAVAALNENATAAGWKSKPSWFLVSEHDNAISPDAEQVMAQRMGAATDTIDGSHTAFIAKPVAVATFIRQALR